MKSYFNPSLLLITMLMGFSAFAKVRSITGERSDRSDRLGRIERAENRHQFKNLTGRFVAAAKADYIHLILSDNENKKVSLICPDITRQEAKGIWCNDLEKNPGKYLNKTLAIRYHEESNYIPEAQENIMWKYVDHIHLLK